MQILLLSDKYIDPFIAKIQRYIDDGWQMQGGIVVSQKEETFGCMGAYHKRQETYYYQTIVREG